MTHENCFILESRIIKRIFIDTAVSSSISCNNIPIFWYLLYLTVFIVQLYCVVSECCVGAQWTVMGSQKCWSMSCAATWTLPSFPRHPAPTTETQGHNGDAPHQNRNQWPLHTTQSTPVTIDKVCNKPGVWLGGWMFLSRCFRVIQGCYKLIFRVTCAKSIWMLNLLLREW